MKAIIIEQFGGPENLKIGEWPKPVPRDGEILVKVAATALNRADTLQRAGKYPPPKGESPIMGLEMAGTVVELGAKTSRWKIGDEVCGLLAGGGYAAFVSIHEDLALPVPSGLSLMEAAAIPEVFLTAFQALNWLAKTKSGETVLIHAGASGVGTAAIQLVRGMGGRSIATASKAKHQICLDLGAEKAIDYQNEDFQKVVLEYTAAKGANVVIDFVGGPNLQKNLEVLAPDGRMVILAFLGGVKVADLNIAPILRKRLHIMGSTLRARSLDYKIGLSQALQEFAWPLFESGQLKPIIDSVYDWTEVANAHRYMEANKNQGKIVLKM